MTPEYRTEMVNVPRDAGWLAASIDRPGGADPRSPGPVVLVTHGHTGDRIGRGYKLVELGRRLAGQGITCVRFDQTGCGESSGTFQDISLSEGVRDVRVMLDWLRTQAWCDPDRIGHVAISMASMLVTAAEVETGRPSRGIAMWGPVYDLRAAAMTRGLGDAEEFLQANGWFPYKGLKLGLAFVSGINEMDMPMLITQSTSPLCVMHSPDDEIVELTQAEQLHRRCLEAGRPCELHVIEGADHDFNDYPHRQAVIGHSVSFLVDRLRR